MLREGGGGGTSPRFFEGGWDTCGSCVRRQEKETFNVFVVEGLSVSRVIVTQGQSADFTLVFVSVVLFAVGWPESGTRDVSTRPLRFLSEFSFPYQETNFRARTRRKPHVWDSDKLSKEGWGADRTRDRVWDLTVSPPRRPSRCLPRTPVRSQSRSIPPVSDPREPTSRDWLRGSSEVSVHTFFRV